MKREKDQKKKFCCATPFILLLSLLLLYVGVDLVWILLFAHQNSAEMVGMHYFTGLESGGRPAKKTVEEKDFKFHLAKLVRGEDRRKLEETGFACDKAVLSVHCVSTKPVRIDTRNMTMCIPSDGDWQHEKVIRPYPNELKEISAVRMIQYSNTTAPPPCEFHHDVPAVVFSSGSTGNIFHEMSEVIIPLYITTKQFQSRVLFVLEDYNPSFIAKYGAILTHLSAHEAMNPAANATVHCFPASIVGLKYHGHLALNSSDIPGGYGMPEFMHFLRSTYGLRFAHVSQIARPRLLLLSRTNTRRFLNEDEMIAVVKDVGFQVIVVRRAKLLSNLSKVSQLINSCSVLVGVHGAGLTNDIFLPKGAVMIQVELLGTGWGSDTYYGDTARAMGLHYLRYMIEADESSLVKLYGRNSSVVTDPGSVYRDGGYSAVRIVFLDQQNVKLSDSGRRS